MSSNYDLVRLCRDLTILLYESPRWHRSRLTTRLGLVGLPRTWLSWSYIAYKPGRESMVSSGLSVQNLKQTSSVGLILDTTKFGVVVLRKERDTEVRSLTTHWQWFCSQMIDLLPRKCNTDREMYWDSLYCLYIIY